MDDRLAALRKHVTTLAARPEFVHHAWFVKWHLEVVERIAMELADRHPEADRNIVLAMVWLHDYGKIIDYNKQYERRFIDAGRDKLVELGFDAVFANTVADNIERADQKSSLDAANIEVQILSSADGCSHLVGPFLRLWWWEHPDQPLEEIMAENVRKLTVDWEQKVVLPEAKKAFQARHDIAIEQSGVLPAAFMR